MRALAKTDAGPGLELIDVPVPELGPGDVLVQVFAGGVCGTDLHIYQWDAWARSRILPPRVIGHEFCGTVAGLGTEVTEVAAGDFVSAEGHVACGRCHSCRTGSPHICERLQIIGVDRDGGFAEYVAVPAGNVWKLDPSIPRDVAAVMDPLGNAVHTALQTPLVGKAVAVIGCGPIGLMAIPICHMAGAALVVASDVAEPRLALARRMGADLVLNASAEDVPARIRQATGGRGADVVLEMSGHPRGLRDGLRALGNGGWVSLLGLPSGPVDIDLANEVIFKEAHLAGVFGRRMWETWEQASALLNMGLDITPVITHRFPLERFEEAFALLQSGEAGKVILYL
ncbi:MAG TPA: L-threonine 3-dehydrogenase [bacterium]|nr:L-threonine 3-dehydrogenase [bacterium]